MESTNQAPATMPSPSLQTPTSNAQPSAVQYATSVPQTLQAPPMPQLDLAQHPAYQASAQAQQASAPMAPAAQAGNPWQEAFQALSASLNTSSPSLAQAQYSAYQTPTPQANIQANWASMQSPAQAQYMAPQTYSPQVSTPSYLQETQPSSQPQDLSDGYLSQVSDASLEVLEHFGAEAPALLNQYACAVEDALIEQVQRGQSASLLLEAAGEERAAMNLMLTDPDVLADYVNDFYGPNGPYPTPTERELAQMQAMAAQEQFAQEIYQQEMNTVPQSFQRPQQDMPARNIQSQGAQNFWAGFGQLMDNNPEDAWKRIKI